MHIRRIHRLDLYLLVLAVASMAGGFALADKSPTPPPAIAAATPLEPRLVWLGKCINVVDGDTIDVEISHVVRVRLLAGQKGCWAPESKTKDLPQKVLGLASKKHLEGIALGKNCLVALELKSNRLIDHFTLERMLANAYPLQPGDGPIRCEAESWGEAQIRTKNASSTKGGELGK